ncbi:hypothetical protein J4460_03490 [Candidatus Woesearchaeota archaeon]|nr:MAG: hypothetical protein QS99_C0008G0068 [archaeon GW2011_AR4]MBS3129712.1 hypothetical protein [Candidatus Woesearchaeota archaeon]HIH39014.1 hypothetical protein [Candidatus Woesearchaeota archaeon]HIH49232.1 hypothetical protein [Candidatus Woesearchaeota archaeon]HIJ03374.1 hypothetical protein [Candidatus Woesearchaeota archaeon]
MDRRAFLRASMLGILALNDGLAHEPLGPMPPEILYLHAADALPSIPPTPNALGPFQPHQHMTWESFDDEVISLLHSPFIAFDDEERFERYIANTSLGGGHNALAGRTAFRVTRRVFRTQEGFFSSLLQRERTFDELVINMHGLPGFLSTPAGYSRLNGPAFQDITPEDFLSQDAAYWKNVRQQFRQGAPCTLISCHAFNNVAGGPEGCMGSQLAFYLRMPVTGSVEKAYYVGTPIDHIAANEVRTAEWSSQGWIIRAR